ncbi:PREDICTED: cis-aconitate decarboxylase-like [Nanorana parkeri]|uniref:cis-aconitate decarboxylase-like n=1 Tax=Nanorana parkeri TaxID=125878 RepID=UPI00085460F6|nr:PREDICTED: cis-aconitate decarboxylase-like [Nanorana parkeri]
MSPPPSCDPMMMSSHVCVCGEINRGSHHQLRHQLTEFIPRDKPETTLNMFSGALQKTKNLQRLSRHIHKSAAKVVDGNQLEETVTNSFASFIHGIRPVHLSDIVRYRSKRMILDSIGVGVMGSTTHVFNIVLKYCQDLHFASYGSSSHCSVYGQKGLKLSPTLAAYANGVAVHSMDFDDTWHPATHPSGAVLPALLALTQMLCRERRVTGEELLTAFNVGIEVQGRLMCFSKEAKNIPKKFHPPSVVGTMGSAAASAKLLALDKEQCMHALAIAASLAGAPMANAATLAKPLHIGNATRLGMEAAILAAKGMEANALILDDVPGCAGFSAFYGDYQPKPLALPGKHYEFLLAQQDVAFKSFPAHLGMHWVADAAISVRNRFMEQYGSLDPSAIQSVVLRVPISKYINRPSPDSEHQARHSFQFSACTALLDGQVNVASFHHDNMFRKDLRHLLSKVVVEHPGDNEANFDKMYAEVALLLRNGGAMGGKCDTFYGHWRKPLTRESLLKKFISNTSNVLQDDQIRGVIQMVEDLESVTDTSQLPLLLQ